MARSKQIELSIIIVNFNGSKLLFNCLNSIKRHVSCHHEIIVVDNASTDNSVEFLQKQFPNVILVKNCENIGFAAGNNIGVSKANGEYILLLNNDTILLTSLSNIFSKFAINSNIGVLGCTLKFENMKIQPSYGYEHNPLRIVLSWLLSSRLTGLPKIFKRLEINTKRYYTQEQKVEWVSGAALFTKIDIWNKLEGMDENYFMYIEDVDYCRRIREIGLDVFYLPDAEIVHLERGGIERVNYTALTNTVNSYLIYLEKYYGKVSIIFVRSTLSIIFTLRSVYFYFIGLLQNSTKNREQSKAYFKNVIRLISLQS